MKIGPPAGYRCLEHGVHGRLDGLPVGLTIGHPFQLVLVLDVVSEAEEADARCIARNPCTSTLSSSDAVKSRADDFDYGDASVK